MGAMSTDSSGTMAAALAAGLIGADHHHQKARQAKVFVVYTAGQHWAPTYRAAAESEKPGGREKAKQNEGLDGDLARAAVVCTVPTNVV